MSGGLERMTEDMWKSLKYRAKKKNIKKSYANLLLFGDVHYGSKHCDVNLAKKTLDESGKRGDLILGMGDLLECATRDSVGAGVYDQDEIIQEQLEMMYAWLEPYKNQIIGLLDGNHESRVYKSTGLNLMKTLAKMLNVPYLGSGRLINLKVGTQSYDIYATHGSSGATMPHTKIRGCMKMQEIIEADVYAMGHVHELYALSRPVHKFDKRLQKIVSTDRQYILTGHFLNYFDSYAHTKNMIPGKKGSPLVKLCANRYDIKVEI